MRYVNGMWMSEGRARVHLLEAEVERLRPIVAHVAGLVHQDPEGYSQVHRTLIEQAREALRATP